MFYIIVTSEIQLTPIRKKSSKNILYMCKRDMEGGVFDEPWNVQFIVILFNLDFVWNCVEADIN